MLDGFLSTIFWRKVGWLVGWLVSIMIFLLFFFCKAKSCHIWCTVHMHMSRVVDGYKFTSKLLKDIESHFKSGIALVITRLPGWSLWGFIPEFSNHVCISSSRVSGCGGQHLICSHDGSCQLWLWSPKGPQLVQHMDIWDKSLHPSGFQAGNTQDSSFARFGMTQ